MQSWTFHNPTSVFFGPGVRRKLAELIRNHHCLIVTSLRGHRQFCEDVVLGGLAVSDAHTWMTEVLPQPELTKIQTSLDALAGKRFDAVVAFGGGSAMDTAKAMALCLAQESPSRNLADVLGSTSFNCKIKSLPLYAVPTTSGTGSEVTPFATIWDMVQKKKRSLANESIFPCTAVVDPELTYGLPWEVTLSTGLDAFNQAFESVWNKNVSNISFQLAVQAVRLGFDALPKLKQNMDNTHARSALAEASLLSGLCISQTRTALCHAISYPLSLRFGLSHGFACAFSMRAIAELCLKNRIPAYEALAAAIGIGNSKSLTDTIFSLFEILEVNPHIKTNLPDLNALLKLTDEMYTASRSDNFIVPVNEMTLLDIIKDSYDML
ncbi:phosphonoacetaldehyde reductase [Desulfosarcina sp. OttesenSCG-928-G17]|nr:phosphonoacetaldehyde reductase [Desulfosarcina sp. OttesenSCG-928-G17]